MSGNVGPIGEDDLHAYVDEQLDPDRRREVEAYLAANPEVRRRIDAYGSDIAALRRDAGAAFSSPVPIRLRMTEIRRALRTTAIHRLKQIAAGVVLVVFGAAIGSSLRWQDAGPTARAPMTDAMSAYRVFAKSPDGAVEIDGTKRVMLVNRIAGHLGQDIAIPDLSRLGLTFLGGRLLASDEGPGGMFVYAEPSGERIAVYVKTLADGRRSAFGSRQDGDVIAYYWFDGRLGYAVTGQAGSAIVANAAEMVRTTYR
ncbi:MAG: anti-sigma factor [Hyphomicrobium aestuarii]|nr:anti-sigma factor [Hyphomicrobium aestuarii]